MENFLCSDNGQDQLKCVSIHNSCGQTQWKYNVQPTKNANFITFWNTPYLSL